MPPCWLRRRSGVSHARRDPRCREAPHRGAVRRGPGVADVAPRARAATTGCRRVLLRRPGQRPGVGGHRARRRAPAPEPRCPERRLDGAGGVAARAPRLPAGHARAPATSRCRGRAQQQPPPPARRDGRLVAVARAHDPAHSADPVARARDRDRRSVTEPLAAQPLRRRERAHRAVVGARHPGARRAQRSRRRPMGRRTRRRRPRLGGPARAGEGTAPGHRHGPGGRPTAPPRGPGRRCGLLHPARRGRARGRRRVRRPPRHRRPRRPRRGERGHARDAGVGRAVRPRRGGVPCVRHAGRGPRPRWPGRVRRARRRAAAAPATATTRPLPTPWPRPSTSTGPRAGRMPSRPARWTAWSRATSGSTSPSAAMSGAA